jgi:hypothetical protein
MAQRDPHHCSQRAWQREAGYERRGEDRCRTGASGCAGTAQRVTAGLFDLDGMLTNTAAVHDKAWKGDVDDLASLREAAAKVEPYLRADGSRIRSLMQLERQLRPEAYRRRRGGYLDRRRIPAADT